MGAYGGGGADLWDFRGHGPEAKTSRLRRS